MDILWTIVVGGIMGWLASIVMKTNAQMGILMNIAERQFSALSRDYEEERI